MKNVKKIDKKIIEHVKLMTPEFLNGLYKELLELHFCEFLVDEKTYYKTTVEFYDVIKTFSIVHKPVNEFEFMDMVIYATKKLAQVQEHEISEERLVFLAYLICNSLEQDIIKTNRGHLTLR